MTNLRKVLILSASWAGLFIACCLSGWFSGNLDPPSPRMLLGLCLIYLVILLPILCFGLTIWEEWEDDSRQKREEWEAEERYIKEQREKDQN